MKWQKAVAIIINAGVSEAPKAEGRESFPCPTAPALQQYLLRLVQVAVIGDQSSQDRNHRLVQVIPGQPFRDIPQPLRHLLISELGRKRH